MISQSEKISKKKPVSSPTESSQLIRRMDVKESNGSGNQPQIVHMGLEEGVIKTNSRSFSLLLKENIQAGVVNPQDRPVRSAQQNIEQFGAGRKKVKAEIPQGTNFVTNKGHNQTTKNKSDFRQKSDPEKQKAELAHQIIKIIQKPPINIKQKLLQTQILEQIYNGNKYQKQNVQKILNLFQKGVILDHSIYSQQRIIDSNIIGEDEIVFYPTALFTGEIFQRLKNKQKRQILMGHQGISKTMSTVLYQQLTDFIVDYRLTSNLTQENHENCTKVIYWSINIEQDTQQTVKELLNKQFSKAQTNFKEYFQHSQKRPIQQNWKGVFADKNIRTILVVDKINCLISKIRDKKYKHQNPNAIEKDQQFHISQVKNAISKYIKLFDRVVFISSINLQTQLLEQIQCFKGSQSLMEHIIQMSLTEKQELEEGRLDMINFFVRIFFEFFKVNKSFFDGKKIHMETSDNSRNNSKLQSFKKQNFIKTIVMQLFNSLNPSDVFYLTQYVVRHQLKIEANNYQTLRKIENITSLEELTKEIKIHFQNVRKIGMPDSLRPKMKQFIKNNPQLQLLKTELILQIYRVFEQRYKNRQERQSSVTIPVNQINLFQEQNKTECIKQILDRSIFSFNNSGGGQIKLLIPAEVFLNLKIDNKSAFEYALDYLAELKYEKIIEDNNAEIVGGKLQFYLKKVLSLGCTSLIIHDKKGEDFRKFSYFQQHYIQFVPILQHKSESHLKDPQRQKLQRTSLGNCIRTGLQTIIKKQKNQTIWWVPESNDQTFYVFLPGRKEFTHSQKMTDLSNQKMLENQKAIDMILVSFSKEARKISATAIGVTLSCRKDVINSKLEKFLKCFKEFEDKNETTITLLDQSYEIEINYYVVSPENETYKIFQELQKTQHNFPFGFTQHERLESILQLKRETNSKYKLLNQIGHLSLTRNLRVSNKDQKVVDFRIYEKLSHYHFRD